MARMAEQPGGAMPRCFAFLGAVRVALAGLLAAALLAGCAEPGPAPQIIEEPVAPPVVAPPPPPPVEAAPERTPEEVQIEEDAAATGMTTVEPEPAPPVN